MYCITNTIFSDREKRYLEFVLQYDFPERSIVVDQLNKMKAADITRDVTPYYWIMEFRPDGINPGYGPMSSCIDVEVLHGCGAVSTEFTLYMRNGVVFELEIYNVDSSEMDLDAIFDLSCQKLQIQVLNPSSPQKSEICL